MVSQQILIICGIIALLVVLTIVGILSRYKKCRSDEVLVVYGKTSGKSSAKCYHGGAAFVWPVIQGYAVMSMKPMQIQCDLDGALSAQKIKVRVPTVVTVAISEDPEVMQNAAIRLLGLDSDSTEDQIKDIIWGQMRLVVAEMTVEQLISDRDNFLGSCKNNIEQELKKVGLALININISDITDEAHYIENLGKRAAQEAASKAEADIAEQVKLGKVGVANQVKEQAIKESEIQRDKEIEVAGNEKSRAEKVAVINQERATNVAEAEQKKEVNLRTIAKQQAILIAEQESEEASTVANTKKQQAINVAAAESEEKSKVAEQERLRDVEIAKQLAETESETAAYNAKRDAEIAERNAESLTKQQKAKQEADASVVEFEQTAAARKEAAAQEAEAKKRLAKQEKESKIAEYESSTRQRQAKATQDAKVSENKAGIEIAKSDAALGKEQASAKETVGVATAQAEENVGKAQAKARMEIAKAERAAREAELNTEILVNAENEKERALVEAEGIKNAAIAQAQGEAEAIRLKAIAEADRIKAIKLAEAEGAKAMAEAKRVEIAAQTANISALKEAGIDDVAIVQIMMKDEYKFIVEAEQKKFEHLQLGDVKVIGGNSEAGKFLTNVVDAVQKSSTVADQIPGLPGVMNLLSRFDASQIGKLLESNKKDVPTPTEPTPGQPAPETTTTEE